MFFCWCDVVVVVVFLCGTIRMKKETCIYLILPKGMGIFWDSWVLYFVEVIRLTILQKRQYFQKANKINNLGNI